MARVQRPKKRQAETKVKRQTRTKKPEVEKSEKTVRKTTKRSGKVQKKKDQKQKITTSQKTAKKQKMSATHEKPNDQFKVTTAWSVHLESREPYVCDVRGDSMVTIRAKNRDYNSAYELVRYSLEGKELNSEPFPGDPHIVAMTLVHLDGKVCVALAYEYKRLVEFRDVSDLEDVIFQHSTEPIMPKVMCSSGESTLVYHGNYGETRFLDCSTFPPQLDNAGKKVTGRATRSCTVKSEPYSLGGYMCCTLDGDKELLIIARSHEIRAINRESRQMEWVVSEFPGKKKDDMGLCGMTTDGRGHLFVCLSSGLWTDNGVHVFSASDGGYLGQVIKPMGEGEGFLRSIIGWSEAISSLVVVEATMHGSPPDEEWMCNLIVYKIEE